MKEKDIKMLSMQIVNELYRARLFGENETDCVTNLLKQKLSKV